MSEKKAAKKTAKKAAKKTTTKKAAKKTTAKKAAKKTTAKKAAKKTTAKKKAEKTTKKATPAKADTAPAPKPVAAEKKAAPPAVVVELVNIEELAKELRLPLLRVKKMVRAGQIPGVKVEGVWKFNLRLVQQAMRSRSKGR